MRRAPSTVPFLVAGALLVLTLPALAHSWQKGKDAPPQEETSQFRRERVAPDERRALLIGTALWQASATEGAVRAMTRLGVSRSGEAWITEACDPRSGTTLLDGCAYVVFDGRDGARLVMSEINPPSAAVIRERLVAHRGGK